MRRRGPGRARTVARVLVHLLFFRCPHAVHRIRAVIHDFIHSLSTAGAVPLWRILVGRAEAGIPSGNKQENTIAPFRVTAYHGFMTVWQTLKRAGYMHPDSSLDAALFNNRCGVVAV